MDRAGPNEPGDFVITDGRDDRTPVRLLAAHLLSDTEPLLLDKHGNPFASIGDDAWCIGGYLPSSVDGEPLVFVASELRVREDPVTSFGL